MAIEEQMKLHVAFLPSPGMGHIIPLFELAKRLVASHVHSVFVSFLVITTDASPAQNQLFQGQSIPPGMQIVNLPPADLSNVVNEETLVISRLSLNVQESLKPLRSVLADINPAALVIDLFTGQSIDVAKELSIPVYCFSTTSASYLTFALFLPTLDNEVEGEFVDLPGPIKVPGRREELIEDLLDPVRDRKIDEYKWILFHMSRLTLVNGILENSWEELEPSSINAIREHEFYKRIQTPPLYPLGPIVRPAEAISSERDGRIMAWLDKQPADSVLFVVFGSGGTLTSEQLTELAWGLEMSQQRFILVAREPSDGSSSAAFFNVGDVEKDDPSVYLPQGFAKRTEGVGLIVASWAPQVAILGHASTGAFLSHCGWNSSLESLAHHGVPIIAWPLYAEQRMNATLLAEEIGVAVKLAVRPGESVIGREEIERVVGLMMEGEEGKAMRRKARMLKESADKALNCGGSSFSSLSRVVDIWKSHS